VHESPSECVIQRAARIGDADHQLLGLQQPCRPTAPDADPENLSPRTNEGGFCGTNRLPKTHISETRTVQYRLNPWFDRIIFIADTVEKNGRLLFRARVEETSETSALEIPEWMFESSCGEIGHADGPADRSKGVQEMLDELQMKREALARLNRPALAIRHP
jgi:hypothetical protein